MRASNLIRPLHFFRLDHESANLLLAILGGCKRNDEVCAIFTVWLELASLGVHGKLLGRVLSEMGVELCILLHMVGKTERHARCLVQR